MAMFEPELGTVPIAQVTNEWVGGLERPTQPGSSWVTPAIKSHARDVQHTWKSCVEEYSQCSRWQLGLLEKESEK